MLIARVFTLYPEFFPGPLGKGLYGKALAEKIWELEIVNIRDYATDKHKTVDLQEMEGLLKNLGFLILCYQKKKKKEWD